MRKIIIGISEGSKHSNYENWIKNEPDVEIITLSHNKNNIRLAGTLCIALQGGKQQ